MLPTICELLGADVPLQCDGRALTPWLRGESPDDWRAEYALRVRLPRSRQSALFEDVFGVTMEECCARGACATTTASTCSSPGYPALPSIFFDLDADPAQIHNVAGDPAYAATVLDYAQRMLAWRMQHTERTLTGMKLTMHAGLVERRAARK